MTSPLLLPPLLLKRALDDLHDLHDLAGLARGLGSLPGKLDGLHDEIRGLREDLEPLPGDIEGLHEEIRGMRADLKPMPAKLDDVYDGLKPMEHLGAVRENVAPLEPAIVSVREAVDELEPARAVAGEDAEQVHAILTRLGYLPDPPAFEPEALLEWLLAAGEWYLQPGARRLDPQYVTELIDSTSSPRAPWFEQLRRLTIPPQALLVRRMEGLIFTTLGELRAGGDWYTLASEYFADAAPSTALGEADDEHWNFPRSRDGCLVCWAS